MVAVLLPSASAADRHFVPNSADPVAVALCAPPGAANAEPAGIRDIVECEHPARPLSDRRRWRVVREFYRDRTYAPAWSDGRTPSADAAALLQVLAGAPAHGFTPSDYTTNGMAGHPAGGALESPAAAAENDVALTWAFINYGLDVFRGRVAHPPFHPIKDIDMEALLEWALSQHCVTDVLQQLAPRHVGYARLQAAVAAYRRLDEQGGWPAVPDGPMLQRGDRGARVTALRRRLAASGDLAVSGSTRKSGAVFDAALQAAVRRFQQRHGLPASGSVNPATFAALNVPVQQRIRELELNLERWRWLPTDLGYEYILVNVPAYELRLIQRESLFGSAAPERTLMQMRVIVGDTEHPTKAFSAALTQLVTNPFWNVPSTIAVDEMIPGFMNDRAYFSRRNIRVLKSHGGKREEVDPKKIDWSQPESAMTHYTFRQDPGPQNALGRIKFIMPNPFGIYLHDTPKRQVFSRRVRLASHGCIRLERPLDLATQLLGDLGDQPEPLVEAVENRTRRHIRLPQPVPIHLVYFTAWVDDDGLLQFRPDVYEEDAEVDAALGGAPGGSTPVRPDQLRSAAATY